MFSANIEGKIVPLVKSQTFGDFVHEGSWGWASRRFDSSDSDKFFSESEKYFKQLEDFIAKNIPDDWFIRLADIGALRAADAAGRDTGQLQDYGVSGWVEGKEVHFKAEARNLLGIDYAPYHHFGNERYAGTYFFLAVGDAADIAYLMIDYSMSEVMAGNKMPTFHTAYKAAKAVIQMDALPDLPGQISIDMFYGAQGTHWDKPGFVPNATHRAQSLDATVSGYYDDPVDPWDFDAPLGNARDEWDDDDFTY